VTSETKNNFIFAISIGAIAALVSWLLLGESSPFAEYFLFNPALPNRWAVFHFPIYLALMFLNPPSYLEAVINYSLIFIQWTIIGFILKWLLSSLIKIISRTRSRS